MQWTEVKYVSASDASLEISCSVCEETRINEAVVDGGLLWMCTGCGATQFIPDEEEKVVH